MLRRALLLCSLVLFLSSSASAMKPERIQEPTSTTEGAALDPNG